MGSLDSTSLFSRPRIVVCGEATQSDELVNAMSRHVQIARIEAHSLRDVPRVVREASAAIDAGYEAVHLASTRLSIAGAWLRRSHHVPVSVTVSAREVSSRTLWATKRLDHAFVDDRAVASALQARAPRLPVSIVPATVARAADPTPDAMGRFVKLAQDVMPGRLVIGMPWPADSEHVRWYRDAVAPLLVANPVCLLLGAPGRRAARLLTGAIGVRHNFRVHVGRVDGDTISAAARICDLFVVPGETHRMSTPELLLSLVATQVPVVVGGGVPAPVIEHERSAFVVPPGDPFELVSLLNHALSLPAVQRHYLGRDFAEHAMKRWSVHPVAAAYAERLAVLVGRPQIPAELRAA